MLANAEKNRLSMDNSERYYKITLENTSAISNVDGTMRWLDDGQIISFVDPEFIGYNAEFSIKDKTYQKIWFSQLISRGVKEDLQSELLDEIFFKGQNSCYIADQFRNAATFWSAVKDKKFMVEVIGKGFILNKNNSIISKIADAKRAFAYIRQEVEKGNDTDVSGFLKKKTAYRLIEI